MPFVIILIIAVVLLTCGYAIKFGDRVIRLGGIWILANIVVHALFTLGGGIVSPTLHLIDDGIYATGLLPLAFYSVSPWIGALALLACGSFALQSYYLLSDRHTDLFFLVINNSLTAACLLTLIAGTTASILGRRQERRTRTPAALAPA
jgi:hypothetical protein